jgi:hypothetical protein
MGRFLFRMLRLSASARRGQSPFLSLLLLFLATGCPESLSASCPTSSVAAGNFALNLALQPSSPQCRVISALDGGPADGDVAATPASQAATLCGGPDPADGGPVVYLAVQNRTLRQSPLAPDGNFTFTTTSTNVTGTVCNCPVDITETITGVLSPSTPGPFQLGPDGGLTPPIASISGTLVDALAVSAGGSGCLCNVPCNLTYQLTGTRQ